MVECHLPKVDVVGSSPIARSIFLFLLIVFHPTPSTAQVDPDPSRPFNQGQVIVLPATSAYLGDLPHPILLEDGEESTHSLGGWLSSSAGWFPPGTGTPTGLRTLEPGLFFEGIAYPFESLPILRWIPMPQSAGLLDFPASAWWGREAAGGAVQINTPPLSSPATNDYLLWGGGGESFGARDSLLADPGMAELHFQGGPRTPESGSGRFEGLGKIRWFKDDDWKLESGLLAAQNTDDDNWYSFFTDLIWSGPNFQTIQFKPFFETAQLNGSQAQEWGGVLNYHFNLAGLAESHLGFGYSRENFSGLLPSVGREYAQAGFLGDVIGMLTLDSAFRLDFTNGSDGIFSYLVGLQGNQGDLTLLGDWDKGALGPGADVEQMDLGLRFQPNDSLTGTVQYIRQTVLGKNFNGGGWRSQWAAPRGLLIFQKAEARWEGRFLVDSLDQAVWDNSVKITVSFFKWDSFWIKGRVLTGSPFYGEAGADFTVSKEFRIFVSADNVEDLPLSWPDPEMPLGRLFRAGIHGQF